MAKLTILEEKIKMELSCSREPIEKAFNPSIKFKNIF
jgi:hypothetical protein